MSDGLLTLLKFGFLALLYVFFFAVLRAVWASITAPATTRAGTGPTGRRTEKVVGPQQIRVLEPASHQGRTFPMSSEVTIGRAPDCGVILEDTLVSKLHARLYRRDGQVYVEDLGSTNGTVLNGRRLTGPGPVKVGDRVQVGPFLLEVR